MELSLNCRCSRITLGQGVASVSLPIWGYKFEVTKSCWHKNFFLLCVCVCVLHSLISKNTALVKGYANVQRPCIFILLNNSLITEACFNVYRFVAITYFSTIVFVYCFCLC